MDQQRDSNKVMLDWELGHSESIEDKPSEWIPACVPGAIQLDYAKALGYEEYFKGDHYRDYDWMETRYFTYKSTFAKPEDMDGKCLYFVSIGIDYLFDVYLNGTILLHQEGMFTPVSIDITDLLEDINTLEIKIHPPPMLEGFAQALPATTVKPAVSYGWDWHPRLIPSGIWDETYLMIKQLSHLKSVSVNYELDENLEGAAITVQVEGIELRNCKMKWHLTDADRRVVLFGEREVQNDCFKMEFQLNDPHLWWPWDQGCPYLYHSNCSLYDENGVLLDKQVGKIGFRSVRMVMAETAWGESKGFPNTKNVSAFQIEINKRRIFVRGSNFVPPGIFPGTVDKESYQHIVSRALDANFNILRVWGGGPVPKDPFFDMCDETGMLVWQDFPLSCYNYTDDPGYLDVLEQESLSIIMRLREHPCLAIWCGGNELLNSWSGMTEQSKALRLLNKQCFIYDPETPFIPSSPLYGVAHGGYTFFDKDLNEDVFEKMFRLNHSSEKYTAFAEFGIPSPASIEVLKKIIPEHEMWPPVPGTSWEFHHGFKAWAEEKDSWLMLGQLEKYFGKTNNIEELIERGKFLQSEGLKAIYEGARRQKPYCSMALNWCFNEPWPTAANSSIISWPDIPKPGYYAVSEACRPFMISAEMEKFVWKRGEEFKARIWVLNDRPSESVPLKVNVILQTGEEEIDIYSWDIERVDANQNLIGPEFKYILPTENYRQFKLLLNCKEHPEFSSSYTLLLQDSRVLKSV
jgi:beta-mannosidase